MKMALIVAFSVAAVLFAAWAVGVRVVVIQPIGMLPDGVTAIVYDAPALRPIDSPDAFCYRTQGGVSLLCRGVTAGAIAERGTILLRLPYNEWLFRLTGGPFRDD